MSKQELLSVFGGAVVRYAFGRRAEPESVLTAVMPGRPSLSACLCVLDRWMMYYVKQSDPNNGLLSCLRTHTHTHKHSHTKRHTLSLTHTHALTHTLIESLDSLPVCNRTLERLSSNHIYNALRRGRQTRTGAPRCVCVCVWE